ncbi:hypothetical protein llap_4777 [Limosa lapponica baueri]|uniref:Uncharacterized protein n=1 Tax=Limosa lapponica baueri TaxID=1758121 RepID=A0A2I0UFU5_LIMLA|nr:hypothetical protein llap_4777 [Limosa lapponica baueri]
MVMFLDHHALGSRVTGKTEVLKYSKGDGAGECNEKKTSRWEENRLDDPEREEISEAELFLCFLVNKRVVGIRAFCHAPPPLRSHDPVTTSLPCSHSSGDFPDQCGSGMVFGTYLLSLQSD